MVPDLCHHALCGQANGEYTNASTTQLLDVRTRAWADDLFSRLSLPREIMPEVVLPGTDLAISEVCLGTMTWGEQNSERDAHAQLDRAVDLGINFIDTAEMYPVPPTSRTQGRTEAYLGRWLAKHGREGLVIATKVAGPGRRDWIRGGRTDLTRENIAHYRLKAKGGAAIVTIGESIVRSGDPEIFIRSLLNKE